MTLGEKILKLRKQYGLSQEELGDKINVTRQTISNWELNITSPNPDQLKKLSKELNVSIDELLDNDIKDLIVEKVSNTERVSKKSLNLLKIIIGIVIGFIIIFLGLVILKIILKNTRETGIILEESIYCKIYGEEHSYSIEYEELTGIPKVQGGDSYFSDILELSKYNDAHQIFNIINDYVKKNGGSCIKVDNRNLNNLVDVSIKEGTLTKESVTIIISEKEDYDITYGESFVLKKYNSKTYSFDDMKESNNNCAFNMIGYTVTPNKPLELNQNWSCMYGKLDKGRYQLVKDAIFSTYNPYTPFISVEFEIE